MEQQAEATLPFDAFGHCEQMTGASAVHEAALTHRKGRSVRVRRLIRPAPVDVLRGQRGTATSCLS